MRTLSLIALLTTLGLSIWWGAVVRGDYAQLALTLALTLSWAALVAESTERGLLQRRLWVSYALNPSSRLYRLLWGGALFVFIRVILVAPVGLLLFCHLLAQGALEWITIGVITALALWIRSRAQDKVSDVCSPIYSEYLARRFSVIVAAMTLTPLFLATTLFMPKRDLHNISFKEAIASVPHDRDLPSPFHRVHQFSERIESAYSWCVQVAVDELDSFFYAWLKEALLVLFVLHKTLVAFAAARLISGLITLSEFERVKLRLSLIGERTPTRYDV
jgi:hypothetical protein